MEGGTFSSQISTFSFAPFDAFIVNGWYLKSYRQAMRACRVAGVPVLVRGDSQLLTPRSCGKRLAMEVKQRWLLRQFDGFLTVGRRNREYLEHFGAPPAKIFFVPHFVDNDWFGARAAESRKQKLENGKLQSEYQLSTFNFQLSTNLRTQWGADEHTVVALFVGKFQPVKRPEDVLKAIAINQKSEIRNQKFLAVFVGAGELEKKMREGATRLNVRVHFAGFKNQTELPACYAAAEVLVLPSESETWGLVVNEAMACGLPAIVSDAVGGAPDLIDEGETGWTFPVGEADALAQRLATLAAMKRAGHDFAPALAKKMEVYSLERAVEGTLRAVRAVGRKAK